MQKLEVYQKSVEVDGKEIFFRQIGHAENARHNLIIIHGLQNSGSFFWQKFLKKFGYDYDFCITIPDVPGFGDNKDVRVSDFNEWLDEFIQKINLKNPIFFAHSFGNIWLLNYLNFKKADQINILVSAPFDIKKNQIRIFFLELLNHALLFLKPIFRSKNLNKFLKLNFKIHIFENKIGLSLFKSAWKNYNQKHLEILKKPTLIMYGEKDNLTLPELGRKYRKNIPQSILVTISGSGHDPFMDAENELYLNTKSFLNNFNK